MSHLYVSVSVHHSFINIFNTYQTQINLYDIITCHQMYCLLKHKQIKVNIRQRSKMLVTYMWICSVYVHVHVHPYIYLGGPSTKLSFQSLNRDDVNSVHHVMPVAMYEGIGEDYTILHHVFKPIFDQLLTFTQSVTTSSALVESTPPVSSIPPQCQLPTMLYESETPVQLNSSNTFISPSCPTCEQLCKQHHLYPTPLHSPLSLQHVSMAQVVIAAFNRGLVLEKFLRKSPCSP
jgi:hypothetical protein